MDDLETIYYDKERECPPELHSDVPIIEGERTVGLVCTICGRSVRENMSAGAFVVYEDGSLKARDVIFRPRKDPRK